MKPSLLIISAACFYVKTVFGEDGDDDEDPKFRFGSGGNINDNENTKWQQIGLCGVPWKKPNTDIFNYAGRSFSKGSGSPGGPGGRDGNMMVSEDDCNDMARGRVKRKAKHDARTDEQRRTKKAERKRKRKENNHPSLFPVPEKPEPEVDACGNEEEYDGRIVGGKVAAEHSWPWQVYLSICGKWFSSIECNTCGGVLLAPKYMLSAAHCVPESVRGFILAGAHSLADRNTNGRYTIRTMEAHRMWNFPKPFDNDIALVTPTEDIYMFAFAQPICLPHKTTCMKIGTQCVVTGWGLTAERGGFPDELHEVAVKLIDKDMCKKNTGYSNLSNSMLCAGYPGGKKDACAGDSGGPLVCRVESQAGAWILYGLVSWGYGCARPGQPGVYTDVAYMADWIYEKTGLYADSQLQMPSGYCQGDVLNEKDKGDFLKQNNEMFLTVNVPERDEGSAAMCNYNITSSGLSVINNENYPDSALLRIIKNEENESNGYPVASCNWALRNNQPNTYIQLIVQRVNLMVDHCKVYKKYIVISYTNSKGIKVYRKVCYIRRGYKILSRTDIDIKFESTNSEAPPNGEEPLGFRLLYEFKDLTFQCNGHRTADLSVTKKFTMKSQNFPKPYDSSTQCRWHLTNDRPIHLHVKRFTGEKIKGTREYNSNCNGDNDNLIIYYANDCSNAELETASIYSTICGKWNNKHVVINPITTQEAGKVHVCIVFVGDNDTTVGNGFEIAADSNIPKVKPPKKKKIKKVKTKKPKKPKKPKKKKKVKVKKPKRPKKN